VPIAGGILLFLVLPLIIVVAMLLGAMSALGEDCVPTAGSDSSFGYPVEGQPQVVAGWSNADPMHFGIDYGVPAGTPVLAAADGQVVAAAGDTVGIRHAEGVETWYQYLRSISAKVGDKVERGKPIGASGSGDEEPPGARGDHLHFELRVEGGERGARAGRPDGPGRGADLDRLVRVRVRQRRAVRREQRPEGLQLLRRQRVHR
jgi:murein DD-endopeptidase MepM/ murein hydrolase activator NlpD